MTPQVYARRASALCKAAALFCCIVVPLAAHGHEAVEHSEKRGIAEEFTSLPPRDQDHVIRGAIFFFLCFSILAIFSLKWAQHQDAENQKRNAKARVGGPDEIEVTAEMIEAGAEYFYGAEPFWHRPASYEETVEALKNAYRAMRHKSGS